MSCCVADSVGVHNIKYVEGHCPSHVLGPEVVFNARGKILYKYLIKAAAYRNRVMILSSLTEISILEDGNTVCQAFSNTLYVQHLARPNNFQHKARAINHQVKQSRFSSHKLSYSIGHKHIAVAFNNRAWFYEIRKNCESYI